MRAFMHLFTHTAFYICSSSLLFYIIYYFFFNDTATTEIYTLSLHDALPILRYGFAGGGLPLVLSHNTPNNSIGLLWADRSEEHTSELQSLRHLVCRLLLEKKKR